MSKTRVTIFTILIIIGLYDLGAEWFHIGNLPTVSYLVNKNAFQFSFWQVALGLAIGHLVFNRNNAAPGT